MEKENVLFQVTSDGTGTSVSCKCFDAKQQFMVALAIFDVLVDSPGIAYMLSQINEMSSDPDFVDALQKSTIELPDFDAILKQ